MSVVGAVLTFYQQSHNGLYSLYQPILWLFSFTFMANGLKRIKDKMSQNTDCVIVYETFIILVAVVFVAILCQVPQVFIGVFLPSLYQ